MAYDSSDGLVIMFGGGNASAPLLFNDTWAYDPAANSWTELNPSGTLPPVRGGQAMAYDPLTQQLIMFGGFDQPGTGLVRFNDTWAYDLAANTWTELKPSGSLPPARALHAMAYDPVTRRMIMFGGEYAQGSGGNRWG